jgi:hypothetical protein
MAVEDEGGGIKQTFVSNSRFGKAKRATERRTWRNDGPQVVKACPSTEISEGGLWMSNGNGLYYLVTEMEEIGKMSKAR